MAEKRASEFSVLLRFPGKASIKIQFYSAALWSDKGGTEGHYRLKVGHALPETAGQFSEAWHPAAHQYEFLTPTQAWELVGKLGEGDSIEEAPVPDIPLGTPVRVPNGNILGGQIQYDITRTTTQPVRLNDGRIYVVVTMIGRGAVHVPLDTIGFIQKEVGRGRET